MDKTTETQAESPTEQGDIDYYRMGSAYMEIQPYSTTTSGTF